jgi:hypothetical protein
LSENAYRLRLALFTDQMPTGLADGLGVERSPSAIKTDSPLLSENLMPVSYAGTPNHSEPLLSDQHRVF